MDQGRSKEVTEWHYVGTRTIRGHEIAIRARLHRVHESRTLETRPLVQYRCPWSGEWLRGFKNQNLSDAVNRVTEVIHHVEGFISL
jgi:hypothetical protein